MRTGYFWGRWGRIYNVSDEDPLEEPDEDECEEDGTEGSSVIVSSEIEATME